MKGNWIERRTISNSNGCSCLLYTSRSVIKYQVVIHQVEQDIRQLILLDGNIGSNSATVTYLTSGSSMEYGSQAIRNTSYAAILIAMFVVDSLHATAARNIVFGSCQFHCASIRQRTGGLHKPFSKCTITHHYCTVIILQCTCQDFRCRSCCTCLLYTSQQGTNQSYGKSAHYLTERMVLQDNPCLLYTSGRSCGNSHLLPAARQNTGDNERKDQTGKQYVQDVA